MGQDQSVTVKYKAVIEYLGANYFGWQVQKDRETVQGVLARATEKITGQRPNWVGAGRTDSGVHALGQVAHFKLEDKVFQPRKLGRALNGTLPWDVRIKSLRRTPLGFHAQRDALAKRYEYRIFQGPVLSPFHSGRVFHSRGELDVDAMAAAAALIRGTWDFRGFAASGTSVRTFTRSVFQSTVVSSGRFIRYRVEANGFLQHMVRNIVGTLLEVGRGRREPEDVLRILASRNRRNAGPTALPEGLYLIRVRY